MQALLADDDGEPTTGLAPRMAPLSVPAEPDDGDVEP
jgi:hypothetical protein